MTKPKIIPPDHLSGPSRRFWERIQRDYDIRDEAGLKLLTLASEALDAAESARLAIEKHSQIYTDRFGAPRTRPEVAIQRNAMLTFARLVKELKLDVEVTQ